MILILALVSNKDLVKVIPPISLVIMGAPGSLFLIGRKFIIIELNGFTQLDPLEAPMGCAYSFKKGNMLNDIYKWAGDGDLLENF